MEAQFGEWRFEQDRSPAGTACAQFGFGRDETYRGAGIEIHFLSFPATERISSGQPQLLPSGEILVWDGRLDNKADLARELRISADLPDSALVGNAWLRWHEESLARLLGDWSLSVWNPESRALLLATDFLGSHHLYYAHRPGLVRWCTALSPLVSVASQDLGLDEEYMAGWIAGFPRAELTPWREIRRVPGACALKVTERGCILRQYWSFDPSRQTRYCRDADYEAHFLDLFAQSVRRRLRSAWPVIAELSGGLDSSSIVCVADQISVSAGYPSIDTVSYYNDSESNWNEQAWFSRVEAARGKAGLHIDVSSSVCLETDPEDQDGLPSWPGASRGPHTNPLLEFMVRGGHRVVLSGIGGDEFLGGVPTPIPELENLLARGRILRLSARLTAWSLAQRRPLIHLLRDSAAGFLPGFLARMLRHRPLPPWLKPRFARRYRWVLEGYPRRWQIFGPLPAFQENLDTLDTIRRQLSCTELTLGYPFEKRYPFLDRDLLEFLFSIPREQLVRPGQRRSLMRRALRGIVPDEILGRRRKAYITRTPLRIAELRYDKWSRFGKPMNVDTYGVAETGAFLEALQTARQGRNVAIIPLLRTIALEEWLEAIEAKALLKRGTPATGVLPEFPVGEQVAGATLPR